MVSEPAGSPTTGADRRRDLTVQRLLIVVGAVVFIDTMFYAVISPLLPQLSHQLHLSKLSAGLMTASYPAGMLVASLPGGALTVRVGPRLTVCVGLALLSCSTVAFAFLHTAVALDCARLVEGVGGACTWAGGLAWLAAATPPQRRGEIVGKSVGAAIGGSLFGPVLGALASGVGRPGLFTGVAVVALGLIVVTLQLPDESKSSLQSVGFVVRTLRRPAVLGSGWLVALPAIVSGMLTVLASLRLHQFGAGAGVIGVTFLIGAGLEALLSAPIGKFSDRHGRILPLRIGVAAVAVVLLCFTLPQAVVPFGLLIIALDVCLGLFWAPSMALLADVADAHGLDQAHAAALMNLTWAAGQIIGSAGGGGGAKAFGDLPVVVFIALLCAVTLVALRRRGARRAIPVS